MKPNYTILLYYLYTPIKAPIAFRKKHHHYCLKNKLLGRIIVAHEGINGTISGLQADCERYMNHLKEDPRFASIDFKISSHHQHAFRKLHVRVKREIVHAGLPHILPYQKTGKHISPALFSIMKDQDDVVLLDVRSNYEHKVGKFKNAITLDINHFREFPKKIEELRPLQNKKIITICTGGVKTEKASAYLLAQGFKEVYQLEGGIKKYAQEMEGKDFDGSCYVFDSRVTTPVNKKNPTTISKCHVCAQLCERMINCANPRCNQHIPMCHNCSTKLQGACTKTCKQHPDKRPYDGTGYYTAKLNGYNPYGHIKAAR
jgi:UPF0176 protein